MSDSDEPITREFPMQLWAAADLVTPMAIRVAATLGLADHIAGGTDSATALAEATGTDADSLGRLLEHLVTAGIVTRSGDRRYSLTCLGEQLTDAHPGRGRAWLDINGAVGRADLAMVDLAATIRSGQPAYPRFYGRGFWEDLAADPALSTSFDALMAAQGFDQIVTAYDWSSASHLVDVGGGNGALLAAVLAARPDLEGTVVELGGPAAAATEMFARAGLANRARVVESSFFDRLPDDGDHYVLSGVIHDWADPEATAILRRCAEAAGPGGTVLLVEGLRSGDGVGEISTEMDLRMLSYCAGRERTSAQLATLAEKAGLVLDSVHPAGAHGSVVKLTPFVEATVR